ncbi:MAG: hypothetical protein PHW69_02730 [Elusimicrobiaceae bacterium]|nr:hypothetical protein [Elusimicrobiaceae bacterium]
MFQLCKSALTGKSAEGSTERLLQLCAGYFLAYVLTGVIVKYFTANYMSEVAYLVYSTIGGSLICLSVVFALKWYHLKSSHDVNVFGLAVPAEYLYIIPSGVCTAVVIPTTTLMYTLPISVMVAMVIMRASIIIISRAIDALQIRQGILKKTVYKEENTAVVFAVIAAGMHLVNVQAGSFDFIHNNIAVITLSSYLVAYSIRLYIMNYYKNTRPKGVEQDNKGFFAIEQITSSVTIFLAGYLIYRNCLPCGSPQSFFTQYHASIATPPQAWAWAIVAGTVFGVAAFFSVFLFMFKGRTATFAGLVNRLTSLVAGTAATLITWAFMGGKPPKMQDWLSLAFILVAVYFMSLAEKKRSAELKAAKEIPAECS